MFYYNHSIIKVPSCGADTLYLKSVSGSLKTETVIEDNFFLIDTENYEAGEYYLQYQKEKQIIREDKIQIKENLAFVDESYDPRSEAEKTLEAIDAMLQGRATAQQQRVQIGDKSIQYSTLDELLKWRDYFAKLVRKESGKTATPKRQLFSFGGLK